MGFLLTGETLRIQTRQDRRRSRHQASVRASLMLTMSSAPGDVVASRYMDRQLSAHRCGVPTPLFMITLRNRDETSLAPLIHADGSLTSRDCREAVSPLISADLRPSAQRPSVDELGRPRVEWSKSPTALHRARHASWLTATSDG